MIALARRLPELRGFSFLSSAFIGMQNTGLPLYSNDPRSGETHYLALSRFLSLCVWLVGLGDSLLCNLN